MFTAPNLLKVTILEFRFRFAFASAISLSLETAETCRRSAPSGTHCIQRAIIPARRHSDTRWSLAVTRARAN